MLIRARHIIPEPGVVLRDHAVRITFQRLPAPSRPPNVIRDDTPRLPSDGKFSTDHTPLSTAPIDSISHSHEREKAYLKGVITQVADSQQKQLFAEELEFDLGDAVILPGFINLHTHLELTNMHRKTKYTGSFVNWLKQIIAIRKTWEAEDFKRSIECGLEQAIRGGTTTICDIDTAGFSSPMLARASISSIVFDEFISGSPECCDAFFARVRRNIATPSCKRSVGISPHAPYTVSLADYIRCANFASEHKLPFCTHLAESAEEREFILEGKGEFVKLFEELGRRVPYHDRMDMFHLSKISGALFDASFPLMFIHCTYLDDSDAAVIKEFGAACVFCPRSHAYFKRANDPLKFFLENELHTGIGTDSLASNDSLSMLDELKFLYRSHKYLSPTNVLELATTSAAAALHRSDSIGRLAPDFDADIIAIRFPSHLGIRNIVENIFDEKSEVIFAMSHGRVVYDKDREVMRLWEAI